MLDKGIQRRKVTLEQKAEVLARIPATTDQTALATCDLGVAAVYEGPAVKAGMTARAKAALPPTAIFPTNTSTLPITALARASRLPDRFNGIHLQPEGQNGTGRGHPWHTDQR